MKTRVISASSSFLNHRHATPLVLSSGAITETIEAVAEVRVSVDGREATGRGSILLSDLWAWPQPTGTREQRAQAMQAMTQWIGSRLDDLCGGRAAHPLELGLRLHHAVSDAPVPEEFAAMPTLARAVCLSPFDAAIHDAAGIALQRSAFSFYDEDAAGAGAAPLASADAILGDARAAIRDVLRREPKRELPAWVIVNKGDDLGALTKPWVTQRGYRHFKIKIMGRDNREDVERTVEVFRAARTWGAPRPVLSVDSNEANPNVDSVLDYLQRLKARDAGAFAALMYLEQPTPRDIRAHRHDWRPVSAIKPVMLDEGLSDFGALQLAAEQGWGGLAIKTCKGHSFALVAAAWAHQRNIPISVQDLTNPGLAAIHSALLAAHLPGINGVELNSPQFIPSANDAWLPRLASLLDVRDGFHRLPELWPAGLGSWL
jgi:L-alanine-DL-glutamate epimerase-like enolase superfamily enzyme